MKGFRIGRVLSLSLSKTHLSILSLLQIGLIGFFISPFLILVRIFGIGFQLDYNEFFWALKNTFYQAFVSSFFSLLLGFFFCCGYFALKSHGLKRLFLGIAMAPNFVPPIFVLLAVLEFIEPLPRGIIAISFVHVLINAGLCTALLVAVIEAKVLPYQESAYVLGVSRSSFFFKILLPILKSDLLFIFGFIFTVCFSSFAIPLILGGGRGTTLQVLIFEKMRISQDWSAALAISFLQSGLLIFLSFLIRRELPQKTELKTWSSTLLQSRLSLILFIFLHIALVAGYVKILIFGIERALASEVNWRQFVEPFLNSIFLGVAVVAFIFIFLCAFSFCLQSKWFQKFFDSYSTPSTAFIGFAFLMVWPLERETQILRLALALVFIFIPYLLKLYLVPKVNLLTFQQETAYVLGVSRFSIWFKVVLPQILPEIGQAAGLAGAWAIGDFALSRMLLLSNDTLALVTESLMSSYRLPLAGVLSFFLLLLSLLIYFFVRKLADVFGQALRTQL